MAMSKVNSPTEQIKEVALKVFSEKGFRGATIADIAAKARISPATIYKYFANKYELFESLDRPDLRFPPAAAQERKRSILDAALRVFGHKGFVGASLDEIAELAGISKATIYLYFTNKQELFAELVHSTPPLAYLDRIRTGEVTEDPEQDLTELTYAFLSAFDEPDRVSLLKLALRELTRLPEVGQVFFHEVIELGVPTLTAYFARLIEKGVFKPMDPEFAARSFLGTLISLVLQKYVIEDDARSMPEKEEMTTKMVSLFLHGAITQEYASAHAVSNPKR